MGEPDMNRQEAILESLPETNRSDPMPDSTGEQVPESPSEDEDDEGEAKPSSLSTRGQRKPSGTECSKPPGQPGKRRETNREFFARTRINGASARDFGQRDLGGR